MQIITAVLALMLMINGLHGTISERLYDTGIIELLDTDGNKIGHAEVSEWRNKGVTIHIEASNLSPGKHGIHIHEFGKCDPPDFISAGGHFNPFHKQHGFHNPKGYHSGDLPNLNVGGDGKVIADFILEGVTLEANKPNSLRKPGGTSIIIHEKADDFKTDPSGNSGSRIACGVIQ